MTLKLTLLIAMLTAGQAHAGVQAPITTDEYLRSGHEELRRLTANLPNSNSARNIIIFIGDGMGVSTLTAARIHQGQRLGQDGESFVPAMDRLSHTALVRTYSHDAQVADSAPTATAILAGVKARNRVIGLGPEAEVDDCPGSKGKELPSLFKLAQETGRATGLISTARITHATPAAAYAHTPQRDWEADVDLPATKAADTCLDIARQMIEGAVGSKLDFIAGGGRSNFLTANVPDPEYSTVSGRRRDGRDLVTEWRRRHPGGRYVWNKKDFDKVDLGSSGQLLALFEPDHMQYEADRKTDGAGEPSLAEMTRKAIVMLERNANGYVLLVEAGRIDHAHHAGNARRALEDTVALDEAVQAAMATVDVKETLVLATADHSHTFTISGYPHRGNQILGIVTGVDGQPTLAKDGKTFTTLGYANGPGALVGGVRPNPRDSDTTALDYRQQSLVPLSSETHGGDDVVARASGPMSHLFKGTIEQHSIYHILRAALVPELSKQTAR